MFRKYTSNSARGGSAHRAFVFAQAIEALECRQLLAAHILGSDVIYPTIQSAVDAAGSGATITVDPGVYSELVVVYKPLTLLGAQAGVDARSNLRVNAATQSAESVVNGQLFDGGTRSSGFYIIANDVTLDGFTVEGQSNSGNYGAGIVIGPNQHGTHILDNIAQDNVAGLYASNDSSADALLIQHNVFQDNNTDGQNSGRGIYSDGGVSGGWLTNVVIDSNAFFRNRGGSATSTTVEAAVSFEALSLGKQADIRITHNTFDANGKAVLFYNATNVLIDSNDVTYCYDVTSAALRFEGGMSDVTITNNSIHDSSARAIRIDENASHQPNRGFVITANNIDHNGLAGGGLNAGLYVDAGMYDGTLDATGNWWGSATGPGGDGASSGGTGDRVFANGNDVIWAPFAITPFAAIQQRPYLGSPASPGEIIQAEGYDRGGSGVAYVDTTESNLDRQLRRYEGVDIQSCQDSGGGYNVDYVRPGEWIAYTVDIPRAGAYSIDFRLASAQSTGGKFHVELNGVNVSGPITMINTGGNQRWMTQTVGGVMLPAGQHVLRLVFDANGNLGQVGNFNWFRLSPQVATAPPAPSDLMVSAVSATTVTLAWTDNSSDETGFVIERQTGSDDWTPIATTLANVTSYVDATVQAQTSYAYRVHAINAAGNSDDSNVATATTPAAPSVVVGWSDGDIGSPALAGSASINDGVYTVQGAGVDIWNKSDQFHYVYQQISGDFTLTVRVTGVSYTNSWAKAGLMVRQTLDANSRYDSIYVTPLQGVSNQYRVSTGGWSKSITVAGPKAPYWVRMVRSGSTITSYASSDGVTWRQIGTQTMTLPDPVYIGLAVTSHNTSALCTATFDNVSIT